MNKSAYSISQRRIFVCLLLWVSIAIPAPGWSQVLPQEPGPVVRPPAFPPAPPVPSHTPIPRIASSPDYWIISSRHCKDQLEFGQPCDYCVLRFDGVPGGRCSSLDELYASLLPQTPVCIMIHGSFVQWDSMLNDSAGTHRWLRDAAPDRPLQMIFYTWPSENEIKVIPQAINTHAARVLGRRAEMNSYYLSQLVSRLPDSTPICLMGHSHGTRTASATLQLLSGGTIEGRSLPSGPNRRQRIRTVLAAAAMDHDWFNPGERYDLALCRTEAVLNLQNRHDLALFFHPTHHLFAARALGRSGVTAHDEYELGTSSCRITDYDVTDLIGYRHFWPNYYRQPEIANAIRHYVYFDD